MPRLRAAAAAVDLPCRDDMVLCGSILPKFGSTQVGRLRAAALVLEADVRLCLVSCDVIGVPRDLADAAAQAIETESGIPFDNVLIAGTHTHYAPSTLRVHGYDREHEFCEGLVAAVAQAAKNAADRLEAERSGSGALGSQMRFTLTQEATVGGNSRILLRDGVVRWLGHKPEEHVRPTGPFDPDLPVLSFRDSDRNLIAAMFNHSTHNLGPCGKGRSPGFYGMVAQEIEAEQGGVCLFLPGAFGSTHNLHVPDVEAKHRIRAAVESALREPGAPLVGPVRSVKRPFRYQVRHFDEAAEHAAVNCYCRQHCPADQAEAYVDVFRRQREELRPVQGQERSTWLHVVQLGEVVLVAAPGELFASLGLAIRRRSPFRHTFVVGLGNDEIGYIPDQDAYALGGYQLWTGLHSLLPKGTGERFVDEAVAALHELHDAQQGGERRGQDHLALRRIGPADAQRLQRFYNGLDHDVHVLFCPLGRAVSLEGCGQIVAQATEGARYDLVLDDGVDLLGWAFLRQMDTPTPGLGIGLDSRAVGRGYGKALVEDLVAEARRQGKEAIDLSVVQSNARAQSLYRRFGFEIVGEHTGSAGQRFYRMTLRLAGPDGVESP